MQQIQCKPNIKECNTMKNKQHRTTTKHMNNIITNKNNTKNNKKNNLCHDSSCSTLGGGETPNASFSSFLSSSYVTLCVCQWSCSYSFIFLIFSYSYYYSSLSLAFLHSQPKHFRNTIVRQESRIVTEIAFEKRVVTTTQELFQLSVFFPSQILEASSPNTLKLWNPYCYFFCR